MHKTISEGLFFAKALVTNSQIREAAAQVDIIIAPPYTAISRMAELVQNAPIALAAQDIFWEEFGAFTGAISAPMVKDAGAKYVIIGHSERRQLFQETDAMVNRKIKAALQYDLIPIFCIGETLAEREAGEVTAIITKQLQSGLSELTMAQLTSVVIAYEPVWAIGTGKTATPEEAEAVHLTIRNLLVQKFNPEVAAMVKIIYGGSVKASNSKELLSKPNIDGALVGGASLQVDEFMGIISHIF